jgi:uncharacterized protein Yka (UPF0111/DUF47 family)
VEVVVVTKHAWFMPRDEDVMGLLRAQAQSVADVVGAVDGWASGRTGIEDTVTAAHHLLDTARDQRMAVVDAVQKSFSVPVEPEDAYELAERLSEVAHRTYALLRELQLNGLPATPALAGMCACAHASAQATSRAIAALPAAGASAISDEAARALDPGDHHLRAGIKAMHDQDDVRYEMRMRTTLRRAEALIDACAHVAHRVRYAVTKET